MGLPNCPLARFRDVRIIAEKRAKRPGNLNERSGRLRRRGRRSRQNLRRARASLKSGRVLVAMLGRSLCGCGCATGNRRYGRRAQGLGSDSDEPCLVALLARAPAKAPRPAPTSAPMIGLAATPEATARANTEPTVAPPAAPAPMLSRSRLLGELSSLEPRSKLPLSGFIKAPSSCPPQPDGTTTRRRPKI